MEPNQDPFNSDKSYFDSDHEKEEDEREGEEEEEGERGEFEGEILMEIGDIEGEGGEGDEEGEGGEVIMGGEEEGKGGDEEEKEKEDEKKEEETRYKKKSLPADGPTSLVLEPDHPMMEKFQLALKNHLLRQIEKLSDHVSELNNELKRKEKEREEAGLNLYSVQQEIFKQQRAMEGFEEAIEKLVQERQSLDESVQSKKVHWKEEVDRLNIEKKKEMDMLAEYRKIHSIEKQMEKWENEVESEISVSQRISEKMVCEKNKLLEEKRKMDMFLLRLMSAISDAEMEIKLLEGEIDLKLEEKDTLNQTLADSAADLQALVSEQKRLLSAWDSVIATINSRNLIYNNVSKELLQCQEAFRALNAEIESYKRPTMEEMKKSERLALIFNRFENDLKINQATLKNLLDKKTIIENNLSNTAIMLTRTEAEYHNSKIDAESVLANLKIVTQGLSKLIQEKRSIEDNIENCIQTQFFNDKTAMHFNKLIKAVREKTRKQELHLVETENKIAQKFAEVESLKQVISQNNETIMRMNDELNLQEEELKSYTEEIEKCHSEALTKQGNYATLNKKIEKQMEKTLFVIPGQTLQQLRITDLEKSNNEVQSKNEKMQSFWLLQQSNNMKLTQQRTDQLKDISILKKQVLLLEHRALKTDTEFEREKKFEQNLNKSITRLQIKLLDLSGVLTNKKDYKENLGKENSLVQFQLVANLKDSEHEQLKLKAEIKELEASLEELAETMLATQREILAWEKKFQMTVDMGNDMKKERSSTGEIGQMKSEIHRMEVRYSQLKKAQDKLINDLEQCIIRRDAIADAAEAKEKRNARGFNTRLTFMKKLETIKQNIRAIQNKIKKSDIKITDTKKGHEDLEKDIREKEADLENKRETTSKMDLQLEEAKLQKCYNLEMLIRRQKKCKMYELVKIKKHRLLFKTEGSIDNELQKVKNTNANLVSIMEALIKDFPAYRFQLKKIYNTFRAQPS